MLKKYDNALNYLGTIPERDRRTDGRTELLPYINIARQHC